MEAIQRWEGDVSNMHKEKEVTTNKPQSTTKTLTDKEFYARGLARSRYHDRLFAEGRPRPTNEQFDEGWAAARTFYATAASTAPVVGHHKHCSSWTVTTSGEKKPCDCVCECTHSMFQHIRPGEHYWYEACAVGGCPCMKFSTAAATAAPVEQSDEVTLRIPTCGKCPFVDHSGAFTPGGAQPICGHRDAPDTFAAGIAGDERFHWKYRQVALTCAPPEKCPLRQPVIDDNEEAR